jgi:hypothetical protein
VPKKRGPKTDVLEALLKRVDGLERRLKEEKKANASRSPDNENGGDSGDDKSGTNILTKLDTNTSNISNISASGEDDSAIYSPTPIRQGSREFTELQETD